MLYWLTELTGELSAFNIFRYITFRTGGALITALLFVFDTQLLEGTVTTEADGILTSGAPVPIDRTGAGQQRNRMPLALQVFGYNLSQ